jgi:hypothetical protein
MISWDYFWNAKFATASVQLLNQERNNIASFVRMSVDLSLPVRPKAESDLTNMRNDIRHVISGTASDDEDDNDSSPEMSLVDPYIVSASELYSLANFGCQQDQEAWVECFLPIIATILSKYIRHGTTPNSKKISASFWEAIHVVNGELAGKTVTGIPTAEEALIRLFIIRHDLLATIFKEHVDTLIHLLKNRSALGAPADDVPEGVDMNSVLNHHYILAPIAYVQGSVEIYDFGHSVLH